MKIIKAMTSLLFFTLSGTSFSEDLREKVNDFGNQHDHFPLKFKVYNYLEKSYRFTPAVNDQLSLKEIKEKVKLNDNEVIVIYNNNLDSDNSEPRNIQTLGK